MPLPDQKGFFLMWRCLSEHKIFKRHSHYVKLWMWILSTAAHRGNANERNPVGIVRSSWSEMARQLSYEEDAGRSVNVSPSTARTIVEWLASEGMVNIESVTRGRNAETVLSVCNWQRWQDLRSKASESDTTTPQGDYNAECLFGLWGELRAKTTPTSAHIASLNDLHNNAPHWSQSDVEQIIANVKKYGGEGEGLEFINQRGPAYLTATIKKTGQQVAEYAMQFKPFGEAKNGKNRQSRVNKSIANLDAVLLGTSASPDESERYGAISGGDGSTLQRIQLGSHTGGQ
tara:strand:- start:2235 stop:3098 length:864 start_codon:yes stop_codon:yes gene_type:complete